MIAKLIPFFCLLALTYGGKPYEGVDPNTLSCDPEGLVYLLLPHFTDCSKFFMCVHGEEVEFSCAGGGLIFDFEIQSCNWAWATTCKLRDDPNGDIEEGSGDDSAEWNPETSGEGSGDDNVYASELAHFSNLVLNCATDSTRQAPYKGDCQRYWKCENGSPQAQYCSDGLFFNVKSQQCDFEANVKCNVEIDDELTGEYIVYK